MWAALLFGLATLNVNVPVGVSGQSNMLVTLVDVEGTILAKATSALGRELIKLEALATKLCEPDNAGVGVSHHYGSNAPDSKRIARSLKELCSTMGVGAQSFALI